MFFVLLYFEGDDLKVVAVGTNHKVELTGFDYVVKVGIVEFEKVGSNGERDVTTFTGFKCEALETFQFFYWTANAGYPIVDVKLYDFSSFTFAGIGKGDGGCE